MVVVGDCNPKASMIHSFSDVPLAWRHFAGPELCDVLEDDWPRHHESSSESSGVPSPEDRAWRSGLAPAHRNRLIMLWLALSLRDSLRTPQVTRTSPLTRESIVF